MGVEANTIEEAAPAAAPARTRIGWGRAWAIFIALAIVIYLALYGWSEALVHQYGERNRFFMVNTAPMETYDDVILGASHAMPFDFGDMNAELEKAVGASVINLSIEGAGILPNRLVLDYFFAHHKAKNVIFVLDSFAFYSTQWNEDRVNDANLFERAPLDPDLLRVLWSYPWARGVLPGYASGFIKINNADRLAPDISDMEATKFMGTYHSVPQIDSQRISYLYPATIDPATFERYRQTFEDLIQFARDNGANFVVVKPPTPPRYLDHLPAEQQFDETLTALLKADKVPYFDLSRTLLDEKLYEDTDHLNHDGVVASINGAFGDALRAMKAGTAAPSP